MADKSADKTKTDAKGETSSSPSKTDVEGGHHAEDHKNCCDVKVLGFFTINDSNIVGLGENLQVASGVTGIIYFCFCVISTAVILAVNISGN